MSKVMRFEGTAMTFVFSPGSTRELYVRDRGWLPIESVQVGDEVSRHTLTPSYMRVAEISEETHDC